MPPPAEVVRWSRWAGLLHERTKGMPDTPPCLWSLLAQSQAEYRWLFHITQWCCTMLDTGRTPSLDYCGGSLHPSRCCRRRASLPVCSALSTEFGAVWVGRFGKCWQLKQARSTSGQRKAPPTARRWRLRGGVLRPFTSMILQIKDWVWTRLEKMLQELSPTPCPLSVLRGSWGPGTPEARCPMAVFGSLYRHQVSLRVRGWLRMETWVGRMENLSHWHGLLNWPWMTGIRGIRSSVFMVVIT